MGTPRKEERDELVLVDSHLLWVGSFAWTQDTFRKALLKRHKRKLELLKTTTQGQLANKPPEPVCGCTHHLSEHDKQGRCHEQVEMATAWDENRKPLRYEAGR